MPIQRSDDAAAHGLDRRSFLKLGVGATVALGAVSVTAGVAGCHRAEQAAASGYAVLRDADIPLIRALALGVVGPALHTDAVAREAQLKEIVLRIDQALRRVHPGMLAEVRKLFDLLSFGLTRQFVVRVPEWNQATAEEVTDFLNRWRDSSVEMFNSASRALVGLISITFYAMPSSFAQSGYPGPLAWVYQAVNR